ncbi:MAG TPA: sulfite exporter TauE/SafE family protein, partial [Gammaproteobacteria bacterium]|nr:sulfite exporter TauE/SafE family protein [Gammaproteobacteria bacterium]
YLVEQPEKVAIASSLAIVGTISAVGAVGHIRRANVVWSTLFRFGLPAMAGTYAGAFVAGFIPGLIQLALFSLVMLAAAWRMFKASSSNAKQSEQRAGDDRLRWLRSGLAGFATGTLAGVVGVGGGFLIVPALVLLFGLPMQRAVATSLLIIVMQSASGFYKYLDILEQQQLALDWRVIGVFIGVGLLGFATGGTLGRKVDDALLKKLFASLLTLTGIFIFIDTVVALIISH